MFGSNLFSLRVFFFFSPQILFFINFFIKNKFYSTIHTFKNYFATMFSVLSKNKLYPNRFNSKKMSCE